MLAVAIIGLASGPAWSERWAAWPWLVSLVFVGLPHGAADLAVARRRLDSRELARAAAAYLAILVATLAAFIAAPAVVLAAFAILSVWHFGVARGGFAIGIPLALRPDATARVASEVAAVVGGHAAFPSAAIRWLGIAILAAAVAAAAREVTRSFHRDGWRAATGALAETAVIALLAATTDPLFSVGVFFLCWHAWREIPHLAAEIDASAPLDTTTHRDGEARGSVQARGALKLATIRDMNRRRSWKERASPRRDVYRPRSRRNASDAWSALARVHLAALPLLVPTWLALGAAWWLLPESRVSHSLHGLAILSIAAYVVVTPAHIAAVSENVKMAAVRPGRRPARAAHFP